MSQRIFTNRWSVILIAAFCCVLWGSAPPFIKWGYELLQISSSDTPSILLFAGIRFFIAGLMVLVLNMIQTRRMPEIKQSSIRPIIILALFQTVGQYLFYYLGLAHTTGVAAAVITGTGAFFTLLAACYVFFYEKMTAKKAAGCLIGFLGIVIMNLQGLSSGIAFAWNGELFILISQLFAALSAGLIKRFSKDSNPAILSGSQFVLGGLILAAAGFSAGGRISFTNAAGAADLLYLAFISGAAYTLWGYLLKYNSLSKIGMFNCLIPVVGVFWSAVLLGETEQALSITTFIALVLVIAGIFIVQRQED